MLRLQDNYDPFMTDGDHITAAEGVGLVDLLSRIRACRICNGDIPEPRPVVRASSTARILIAGQAPGTRVHASGKPFTDPSGDRLRDWMGVDENAFYDDTRIALVPMGFCFPGLDAKGGDKPPRPICARTWRAELMTHLPQIKLVLLVGGHAMRWHAPDLWSGRVTDAVQRWREFGQAAIPLPHPSWRNNAWISRNPWFSAEVLPALRSRVAALS